MSTAKIDPQFAIAVAGLALTAVGLFLFLKKQATDTAKDAAGAIAGLATGNNAITRGTPYAGKGVAGTLGASADAVSGGLLGDFGSWLGTTFYDLTHPAADRGTGLVATTSDPDALTVARLNSEGIQP